MRKEFTWDEVNGSLRQIIIQNKYLGFFVEERVDKNTVPDTFNVYEVECDADQKPIVIRNKVRHDEVFYGTIFTKDKLQISIITGGLKLNKHDNDLSELLFGTTDADGDLIIEGSVVDALNIDADRMFSEMSTILPYVQELDEDDNVIEERVMTKEEFRDFLSRQSEAVEEDLAAQLAEGRSKNNVDTSVQDIITNKDIAKGRILFDAEANSI